MQAGWGAHCVSLKKLFHIEVVSTIQTDPSLPIDMWMTAGFQQIYLDARSHGSIKEALDACKV